ncbi:MAG: hypothetical protein SGPRY_004587, partial [Prymnesium sp.]
MTLSSSAREALAAESADSWPNEEEGDCRICLDRSPLSHLIAPCACTGSMQYAHRECLDRWCEEKGSACCEVCGGAYSDAHIVGQLRSRQREEQLRLMRSPHQRGVGVWGEHSEDLLLHPPPRILAMHSTRRLVLLSLTFVTMATLFLLQ